jgi:hypothetical protein
MNLSAASQGKTVLSSINVSLANPVNCENNRTLGDM